VEDRGVITLCTAVALASSLEEVARISCDIKWPNDLLTCGTKVAGILVETRADVVVVGCGVNLWWPDAPGFAGAVFVEDPGRDVAIGIARGWADRLLEMLDADPSSWPRAEYLRRSSTVGSEVIWETGEGLAVGIAAGGGLVVHTDAGETVLTAGEVHTRQPR
jgi:BirA family biotin operon repressor/biotin-[acetyl-CoA-carboxylase] ligase